MTPDLNVLLAASRTDHVHHAAASTWLNTAIERCATGGSIEILPMVAAGFLRLATHPKIFQNPTPIDDAIRFLDTLLAIPGVDMPEIGREWPELKRLCAEHQLTANDIPDAWIASAVKSLGSHLVTFDRDFRQLLTRADLTVLEH